MIDDQIRRLMAERDLLLSAISPVDYAKIQAQLVAVSESPDDEALKDASPAVLKAMIRFYKRLSERFSQPSIYVFNENGCYPTYMTAEKATEVCQPMTTDEVVVTLNEMVNKISDLLSEIMRRTGL
jgi:cell fate (sporulation/competence/biofilm development) regulator YlbF (YheA/YmcA/DUF963 family)